LYSDEQKKRCIVHYDTPPFITYDLLYWFEKIIYHHSIFNWEAIKHSGDTLYLRKRKAYAWKKGYGKKELPVSRWND